MLYRILTICQGGNLTLSFTHKLTHTHTHTHSYLFDLECEPSKYSFVIHCINNISHNAASKWLQMGTLHAAREEITLSYCHFSRELTPWFHLDEIRKSYQDLSITHAGKIGIETSSLSSWMASCFSTLGLWFNIKMSQVLNEMSNIICLWILKIYDCPWRKLDNSAFLCQMCIYLKGHSIKLVPHSSSTAQKPSASLMSQSPFLVLMRKRLHKEKFYAHEAKTTVQSSLWESNLHRIWKSSIKMQRLSKSWTQVATEMTTNHTYSLPFKVFWVPHFTASNLALLFFIYRRIRLSSKIQLKKKVKKINI